MAAVKWLLVAALIHCCVAVNTTGLCSLAGLCHRVAYSRGEFARPRKSLVLFACSQSENASLATCDVQQLDSVSTLQASQLQLSNVPHGLCSLLQLAQFDNLDLSCNRLNSESISSWSTVAFDKCKHNKVKVLHLSDNQIDSVDLADVLSTFPKLEELYLDNCRLKHLLLRADFPVDSCALRVLSLSNNSLINVDLNILSLAALEVIDLTKNANAKQPVTFQVQESEFAFSEAVKLRRMQRTLQYRNFDYQMTVSLQAANVEGLLEGLAQLLRTEHDAALTVSLVSRFISAFDYIRFDMTDAFVDCDALCMQDELSNGSSPALLRFVASQLTTLRRVLSAAHYRWLANVLSVRCFSVHAVNASLRALVERSEREPDRRLCRGLQHTKVQLFAAALRTALQNGGPEAEVNFACACGRCSLKYDPGPRSVVLALDCSGSSSNLTLGATVASVAAVCSAVSAAVGPQRTLRCPGDSDSQGTVPVLIDLNLTASQLLEWRRYEPEMELVRQLTLRGNRLTELDENLFRSMHSLRSVDVRDNALRSLPSVVILASHTLTEVWLQGNLMPCNCAVLAQLHEAQTLDLLYKLPDLHLLRCEHGTLLDVLRNLTTLLKRCPGVWLSPLRLSRKPLPPTTEPSAAYGQFQQFLADHTALILSVCAACLVVLVVLCVLCVKDYVSMSKAQYAQVSDAAEKEPDDDTQSERPQLPEQRCEISSFVTNLVNENRFHDDAPAKSSVDCIPPAAYDSQACARVNLKNVTIVQPQLPKQPSERNHSNVHDQRTALQQL